MPVRDLTSLFAPKSIAVVGATDRVGSVGNGVFQNLLSSKFNGCVYPVNVRSPYVGCVRAYPSIADIGMPVDLAIMAVPPVEVIKGLEACGKIGCHNAVVITAGFKECGSEGLALELQLRDVARANGINVVGPNCLGFINTDSEVRMNASFARNMPASGNLAFITQSGALGAAVLDYAAAKGIGFSKFMSTGNKADLDELDLLTYLADDPATDLILMYMEDIARGREFIELARKITGERPHCKPILAMKTGRTAQGAAAAASHTGSLAGSDTVYDALFAQAGVLRVDTMADLFNYAVAFANQPLPAGGRVGIVTNAGGPGIMATDACLRAGLEVPELDAVIRATLDKALPPTASTRNPVDVIGDAHADRYHAAIDAVAGSDDIDAILVLVSPQSMTDVPEIAREIAEASRRQSELPKPKPILATLMGAAEVATGLELLNDHRVPSYVFPESAVRSLNTMVRYQDWLQRPRTEVRKFDVDKDAVRSVIDRAIHCGRLQLPEIEALQVMKAYGMPAVSSVQAETPQQAATMAEMLGFPVVLKISSPDILHKTDAGGVRLNLQNGEAVAHAAADMIASARAYKPDADIWGVTVTKMARPGCEVILGMTRDPHFGPILMFGLGGVFTEILKDVAFRLAPIRELAPERMVQSIRGRAMLDGVRGAPPSDKRAIYDALERLSQMVVDFPEIAEMDINPMFVYPEGQGASIVDARIILAPKA
ncbi:MAG: acetate--CoA ligase family protein [Capsulimonadaceae bacterium]